jgi:hypothetical protein
VSALAPTLQAFFTERLVQAGRRLDATMLDIVNLADVLLTHHLHQPNGAGVANDP